MENKPSNKPDKSFWTSCVVIHIISLSIIYFFLGQFMLDFKFFINYHDGQQLYIFIIWVFYIFMFELTIFWNSARKFLNIITPILVIFPAVYILAQSLISQGIDILAQNAISPGIDDGFLIFLISPFIVIFLLTYFSTKNYISNNISKANELLLWAILSISITAGMFAMIFAMGS